MSSENRVVVDISDSPSQVPSTAMRTLSPQPCETPYVPPALTFRSALPLATPQKIVRSSQNRSRSQPLRPVNVSKGSNKTSAPCQEELAALHQALRKHSKYANDLVQVCLASASPDVLSTTQAYESFGASMLHMENLLHNVDRAVFAEQSNRDSTSLLQKGDRDAAKRTVACLMDSLQKANQHYTALRDYHFHQTSTLMHEMVPLISKALSFTSGKSDTEAMTRSLFTLQKNMEYQLMFLSPTHTHNPQATSVLQQSVVTLGSVFDYMLSVPGVARSSAAPTTTTNQTLQIGAEGQLLTNDFSHRVPVRAIRSRSAVESKKVPIARRSHSRGLDISRQKSTN